RSSFPSKWTTLDNRLLMSARLLPLDFVWWNVQSFAHYDETRSAESRWPSTPEEYAEKHRRVEDVFRQLIAVHGVPHIVALAEITQRAARAFRDKVLPTHALLSLDLFPN